jgi:hypothetical protein
MKSRVSKLAGKVTHMGRREMQSEFLLGNLVDLDLLEDFSSDGKIV